MKKKHIGILGACILLIVGALPLKAEAQNKPRIVQLDSTVGGPERGRVFLWRNSQPGDFIRKMINVQIHNLRCTSVLNSPDSRDSYALYMRTSATSQWYRVYNFNTDCQTDGLSIWAFLPLVNGDDEFWFNDQQVEAEVRVEVDDGIDSINAVMHGVDLLF